MAGLIMSMRNPDIGGFLSLDSGILDTHRSGLPNSHPHYREERFRIPWNALDSLGEACADRGRTDEAIRSYRRSLDLNPENANARAALERLSKSKKKIPEEPKRRDPDGRRV